MKNDDMKELEAMIPSATVREYVLEKGWHFTDREKTVLLLHNDLPMNELFCRLRNLRDGTDDDVLKEKLTQYLNSKKRELQEHKENGDRYYIYVLKIKDDANKDYYTEGYFFDYEAAYEYGLKEQKAYSFKIDKCPIHGTPISEQYEDKWYFKYAASSVVFKDGEMYDLHGEHSDYDFEYFNFYFEVPYPFEEGDTVKIINSERCGVVNTSQKSWAEDVERRMSGKIFYFDYTDNVVSVLFPDENGFPDDYDHISPLYLEKYQPNEQS